MTRCQHADATWVRVSLSWRHGQEECQEPASSVGIKGAQEQRALDMRKRLAEYQAGREDLRREEPRSRDSFDRKHGDGRVAVWRKN